jgi:Tol biopolymer transport system component
VVVALSLGLVCLPGEARASFPGRDGAIAFSRQAPSRAWTIWVADLRSGRTRRLTHVSERCRGREGTWADHEPSYSASGRLIVFHHEDSCDPDSPDGIYAMGSNGTGLRLILGGSRDKSPVWPAFSPAGSELGFLYEYERRGHDAFITSFASPGRTRNVVRGYPRYDERSDLAWSASGRLALWVGSAKSQYWGHIATVSRDGTGLRLVTRSVRDSVPDWSPTGRHIVFARDSAGSRKLPHFRSDIWVARARGRRLQAPRRMTFTRRDFFPVWSPSGQEIAYVRSPDLFSPKGELWLMRAGDGREQRLVIRQVVTERISWQPLPR